VARSTTKSSPQYYDASNAAGARKRPRASRGAGRWILGIVLMTTFTYVYIGGHFGWYSMWELEQRRSELEMSVSELEAQRMDLTSELEMLKKDPASDTQLRMNIERKAREEHGMARDGEMVFRFRDAEQDKVDGDRKNPLTPRPE